MKNNRIVPLLKRLCNENEFVSIQTLADHLGVSYATARSDLQKLARILPLNTGVERKQGQGVRLYGAPEQISKLKASLLGENVSSYILRKIEFCTFVFACCLHKNPCACESCARNFLSAVQRYKLILVKWRKFFTT